MTNGGRADVAQRIAVRGREVVVERLRSAFADQAAARGDPALDPERLERLVQDAAPRAGEALWRRSLAQAAMEELGITLSDALTHPLLADVRGLIDAADQEPSALPEAPIVAEAQALWLSAVHLNGIETLYEGDDDLELRLSAAGLDVLKRSTGAAIGRLQWSEIETVALPAPRRGLRGRRSRELHVRTVRGEARFELPGLTDDELREQLEPTLDRLRAGG